MRKIALLLIIFGLAFIAVGLIRGGTAGFFLIFPFVVTSDPLAAIGFILIFIGFIILFLSPFYGEVSEDIPHISHEPTAERKEYGGVILIGPFPIAFGSSEEMAKTMLILGIVVFVIFLAITALFFSFS